MKKQITFGSVLTFLKEYFIMTLGVLFYTFAWIACIFPAGGTGGGATGLALVLCTAVEKLFGMEIMIGTMTFLINAVLLLFSGFIVGWKFGIKTIFCIMILPFALNGYEMYLPKLQQWLVENGRIAADAISIFGNLEPILLIIMGAFISGLGIYLCLMQGGSTGGVDIVAMMINKYRPINYGRVVLTIDSSIIFSSLLVGNGPEMVIYGFLLTIIFSNVTDVLLNGNQRSNQIFIVSRKYEEVAQAITDQAHRGVTMLNGMGWYTKEPSHVAMVLCRKRETNEILDIVKAVDPNAFTTVASVTGVYGQGFGMIGGGNLASVGK